MKETEEMDGYAIPFHEIKRLLNFYPYGHRFRIAFELLALTGMRINELNSIGLNSFYGDHVVWKCGKNQKGYRREKLPQWFLVELQTYLNNYPHSNSHLFNFQAKMLRDVLNKRVRKQLGGFWIVQRPDPSKNGVIKFEYVYQLKGLRHSFSTMEFIRYFEKFGGDIAVGYVSRRMHHKSEKLTAHHYICNFEKLSIYKYKGHSIGEILKEAHQKRIIDYMKV